MFTLKTTSTSRIEVYFKGKICYSPDGGVSSTQSIWESPSFSGMQKRFLKMDWEQVGPEQLGRWIE